jgi:hypothetical protein
MIFCHLVQVDWDTIHKEREKAVTAPNKKENKSCLDKQYLPGDQVFIVLDVDKHHSQPKMNVSI